MDRAAAEKDVSPFLHLPGYSQLLTRKGSEFQQEAGNGKEGRVWQDELVKLRSSCLGSSFILTFR